MVLPSSERPGVITGPAEARGTTLGRGRSDGPKDLVPWKTVWRSLPNGTSASCPTIVGGLCRPKVAQTASTRESIHKSSLSTLRPSVPLYSSLKEDTENERRGGADLHSLVCFSLVVFLTYGGRQPLTLLSSSDSPRGFPLSTGSFLGSLGVIPKQLLGRRTGRWWSLSTALWCSVSLSPSGVSGTDPVRPSLPRLQSGRS